MSYTAALDALTATPDRRRRSITVTVPEGRSIGEAAPLVAPERPEGSYRQGRRRATRARSRASRPTACPSGTRTLEGFLFPATYELKRGAHRARPRRRAARGVPPQLRRARA